MFRSIWMLLWAGGGVWGAARALELGVARLAGAKAFHITPEAMPILIPVGLVGALLGAFIGGLFLPTRR